MANPGYDEAYAASRAADIDARLAEIEDEKKALTEKREAYSPKKRSTVKKAD